jgi:hypothetical protein
MNWLNTLIAGLAVTIFIVIIVVSYGIDQFWEFVI